MKKHSKSKERPSLYSTTVAEEICSTIATTSKGIKRLCKEISHWPSHDTIYNWLNKHEEFSDLYARAKKNQIEVLVDEILEISDDATLDNIKNDDGKILISHANINRAKLRIDTRKWLASKLIPRVYGNKDPKECSACSELNELSSLSDEELVQRAYAAIKDDIDKIKVS